MNGCVWVGCTLWLLWAPWSQASLNSARPDAAWVESVTATCNTRVIEHADWGDIAAVVQSTRLCLRRSGGWQEAERTPIYVGVGLVQHNGAG